MQKSNVICVAIQEHCEIDPYAELQYILYKIKCPKKRCHQDLSNFSFIVNELLICPRRDFATSPNKEIVCRTAKWDLLPLSKEKLLGKRIEAVRSKVGAGRSRSEEARRDWYWVRPEYRKREEPRRFSRERFSLLGTSVVINLKEKRTSLTIMWSKTICRDDQIR